MPGGLDPGHLATAARAGAVRRGAGSGAKACAAAGWGLGRHDPATVARGSDDPPTIVATMRVETVDPSEYEALGDLTVRAYRSLPGHPLSPEYAAVLADVAERARKAEVLVVRDGDGTLLGGVTYVADDGSPYAEFEGATRRRFPSSAARSTAQGRGVGRVMVRPASPARRKGRRLTLMTTGSMDAAHHLYGRLGFVALRVGHDRRERAAADGVRAGPGGGGGWRRWCVTSRIRCG